MSLVEAIEMLNKSNSTEWLAGWSEGCRFTNRFGLGATHQAIRRVTGLSGAHNAGYIAALSAAIGVL